MRATEGDSAPQAGKAPRLADACIAELTANNNCEPPTPEVGVAVDQESYQNVAQRLAFKANREPGHLAIRKTGISTFRLAASIHQSGQCAGATTNPGSEMFVPDQGTPEVESCLAFSDLGVDEFGLLDAPRRVFRPGADRAGGAPERVSGQMNQMQGLMSVCSAGTDRCRAGEMMTEAIDPERVEYAAHACRPPVAEIAVTNLRRRDQVCDGCCRPPGRSGGGGLPARRSVLAFRLLPHGLGEDFDAHQWFEPGYGEFSVTAARQISTP
ncbi:hypothetical protein FQA39_LY18795 [Lamprigera yunnana]|nr:hypothetical protein FQA39_LY18795 [Lamprigera yunnana]